MGAEVAVMRMWIADFGLGTRAATIKKLFLTRTPIPDYLTDQHNLIIRKYRRIADHEKE